MHVCSVTFIFIFFIYLFISHTATDVAQGASQTVKYNNLKHYIQFHPNKQWNISTGQETSQVKSPLFIALFTIQIVSKNYILYHTKGLFNFFFPFDAFSEMQPKKYTVFGIFEYY